MRERDQSLFIAYGWKVFFFFLGGGGGVGGGGRARGWGITWFSGEAERDQSPTEY